MRIEISAGGCNTPHPYQYMDPDNQLFIVNRLSGDSMEVTPDMERCLYLYYHSKHRQAASGKGEPLSPFEQTVYIVTGKRQIRRLLGITEL